MAETAAQQKRRLRMAKVPDRATVTVDCSQLVISNGEAAELLRSVTWLQQVAEVGGDILEVCYDTQATLGRIKQNIFNRLGPHLRRTA